MAAITVPGMFLTGDHASRPAATTVGGGSLYACSTHSLVYQSDTSSWTTWATLGTSVADILDLPTAETDTSLVLAPDGAGGVEFRAETGGGLWDLVVDENGSSVANWTARDGTWGTAGGIIQQTNSGALESNLHYTAPFAMPILAAEVDMRLPSSNTGDDYIGMDLGIDSANTANGGLRVYMRQTASDALVGTVVNGAETIAAATTIALDTWYTIRAFVAGTRVTAWKDGTLLFSASVLTPSLTHVTYFGLWTVNAVGDFRNIRVWIPALPF